MARKDKSSETSAPRDDRCAYKVNERRCRLPRSISPSTKGGWGYCRFHYECEDPRYGLEMIEASERWLANVKANTPVAQAFTDSFGRKLPGYGGPR